MFIKNVIALKLEMGSPDLTYDFARISTPELLQNRSESSRIVGIVRNRPESVSVVFSVVAVVTNMDRKNQTHTLKLCELRRCA